MVLDYVALGLLIFGALTVFYLIIAIHDIPYEIAKHQHKRIGPTLEKYGHVGSSSNVETPT